MVAQGNAQKGDAYDWLDAREVAPLTEAQWLDMAWSIAVDDIARGKTRVIATRDGVWRIECDSMETIASLIPYDQIVSRLHALQEKRPLPELRGIAPVPPTDFGQPMALLRSVAWMSMPELLWRRFAWQMSVDRITGETTQLINTENGVWRVMCHSQHAWDFLQEQEHVLGVLAWLHKIRPLGMPERIVTLMGKVSKPAQSLAERPDDDPDIPDSITDPRLRRALAHLRPPKKAENS